MCFKFEREKAFFHRDPLKSNCSGCLIMRTPQGVNKNIRQQNAVVKWSGNICSKFEGQSFKGRNDTAK